ncbi:unnamed protein product [Prorocentrum cordatum]|uniref:Uncharacterized protein n=1 Tax=Prorocentrum cordatum TaxID=2364126 RepID=A0ABN9Y789_9DINO|nr:unnamed protein product [Polarella glacialis]
MPITEEIHYVFLPVPRRASPRWLRDYASTGCSSTASPPSRTTGVWCLDPTSRCGTTGSSSTPLWAPHCQAVAAAAVQLRTCQQGTPPRTPASPSSSPASTQLGTCSSACATWPRTVRRTGHGASPRLPHGLRAGGPPAREGRAGQRVRRRPLLRGGDFFLDLVFEPADEEPAAPLPVFAKAREASAKLREEAAARQADAAARRDVEAELEDPETLLRGGGGAASKGAGGAAPAGGSGAAGGAELRAALAAAAADDSPAAAAAAPVAGVPAPAGAQKEDRAPAPSAPSNPEAAPGGEERAAGAAKGSQNDIDDLLSDFDAALASVGGSGPTAKSSDPPAAADAGAAGAAAAVSKKPVAAKAGGGDDALADFDAFLKDFKDLDG